MYDKDYLKTVEEKPKALNGVAVFSSLILAGCWLFVLVPILKPFLPPILLIGLFLMFIGSFAD